MKIDTKQLWKLYSSGSLALILSADHVEVQRLQGALGRTREQIAADIYPSLPQSVAMGCDSAESRLACVRWYLGLQLMDFFGHYKGLFAEATSLEGATFDEY